MSIKHALIAALALAAAPAARAADPGTTISGTLFLDYSYRVNQDLGTNKAADKNNGSSFDLKRAYLTADHTFDDMWSARLRFDAAGNVGSITDSATGASASTKLDVFVKNAYLQATVAPELFVRAGAADLPWFPFLEGLYGYRYVENVLDDRLKIGTSADWGLHAGGKVLDGLAAYALSVVNGRGYNDPSRTRSPTVEARVSANPLLKELTVGLAGQAGTLGQNVAGTDTPRTATRFDAVVAYVAGPLRLGLSGMVANDYATTIVTSHSASPDRALAFSGWASYFLDPVSVFGRYDYAQPNKITKPSLKDRYFNLGVSYKPVKSVDIALVYKHETVTSDEAKAATVATQNGTFGSAYAHRGGSYSEVGLFGLYAF